MRYGVMEIYQHRVCDRSGHIILSREIELPSLRDAMAYANSRLTSTVRELTETQFDPRGRIEIADRNGDPVARIYFTEAYHLAALPTGF